MLRIENFSKTYKGGKRAVNGLSLHVESGDIYGFIGHNGAGKTTTIKCATGVLDFTEGDICIAGKSIRSQPLAAKQVMAYLPDNPDLYEHLSGAQYINFVADIYGVSAEERQLETERLAGLLGMKQNLGNAISSYSHGMKQKIAIIAALVHKPRLLVLDEPFVGLDPKAAHDIKALLAELCAAGGAVFFSTHVLEVAEKICNKIAIIKNGELIVSGPTKEVIGNESLENLFLELTENA